MFFFSFFNILNHLKNKKNYNQRNNLFFCYHQILKMFRASKKVNEIVRELPVVGRQGLLSVGLVVLLILVAVVTWDDKNEEMAYYEALTIHSVHTEKALELIKQLDAERQESIRQLAGYENKTNLERLRKRTDETIHTVQDIYYTYGTELGFKNFIEVFSGKEFSYERSLLNWATVGQDRVMTIFSTQISSVSASVISSLRGTSAPRFKRAPLQLSTVGLNIGIATLRLLEALELKLLAASMNSTQNSTFYSDTITLRNTLTSRLALLTRITDGTLPADHKDFIDVTKQSSQWEALSSHWGTSGFHLSRGAVIGNKSHSTTLLKESIVSTLPKYIARIQERISDSEETASVTKRLCASLIGACACFAFLQACIIYSRGQSADLESTIKTEVQEMANIFNRIVEYTNHFSDFHLCIPLPPSAQVLTKLELTLMKCAAALKIVAPALPPTLFPHRYTPDENGECDMHRVMNRLPKHHKEYDYSLGPLLKQTDSQESKPIILMKVRTALGMKEIYRAIATYNLLWIHQLEDRDVGCFTKYVCLLEDMTILHCGLVHQIEGDRMICSFSSSHAGYSESTLACKSAIDVVMYVQQLNCRVSNIQVACAITYGRTISGNIGSNINPQQYQTHNECQSAASSEEVCSIFFLGWGEREKKKKNSLKHPPQSIFEHLRHMVIPWNWDPGWCFFKVCILAQLEFSVIHSSSLVLVNFHSNH